MFRFSSLSRLRRFTCTAEIMARSAATASELPPVLRRSGRNRKGADGTEGIKKEDPPSNSQRASKRTSTLAASSDRGVKRIKTEHPSPSPEETPHRVEKSAKPEKTKKEPTEPKASPSPRKQVQQQQQAKTQVEKQADLQAKKWKSYSQFAKQSPFGDFKHPTPAECKLAHRILASLHGERRRPAKVAAPAGSAGCGESSSVLDALVRTILSQNTSSRNSTQAKLNMDAMYGGCDRWDAIVEGGQTKLQKSIESGGLSVTKSKVIMGILAQCMERHGAYSLDHLFGASDEEAMREMLSFQGVGPKTASCVLLFCLQRESFAVDTHVHRITGLLGWRPKDATRDETHAHLDVMIPDEDKYALHVLLITHGRQCDECKAGGKNLGKCELRKAFRGGKVKGEAGEDVKEEEIGKIKEEEGEDV